MGGGESEMAGIHGGTRVKRGILYSEEKKGVCNRNKNLKEALQFGCCLLSLSIFKKHAL